MRVHVNPNRTLIRACPAPSRAFSQVHCRRDKLVATRREWLNDISPKKDYRITDRLARMSRESRSAGLTSFTSGTVHILEAKEIYNVIELNEHRCLVRNTRIRGCVLCMY